MAPCRRRGPDFEPPAGGTDIREAPPEPRARRSPGQVGRPEDRARPVGGGCAYRTGEEATMSEHFDEGLPARGAEQVQPAEGAVAPPAGVEVGQPAVAAQANGHAEPGVPQDWHAEAGRKG